ncbi:MAG TPA: hypothetical protein VIT92_13485, partial [Burkholderiaceae bacterium]
GQEQAARRSLRPGGAAGNGKILASMELPGYRRRNTLRKAAGFCGGALACAGLLFALQPAGLERAGGWIDSVQARLAANSAPAAPAAHAVESGAPPAAAAAPEQPAEPTAEIVPADPVIPQPAAPLPEGDDISPPAAQATASTEASAPHQPARAARQVAAPVTTAHVEVPAERRAVHARTTPASAAPQQKRSKTVQAAGSAAVAQKTPEPAAPATRADADVALLAALMAHTRPDIVRDVVERQPGDDSGALLQRCRRLDDLESRLCQWRICSGRWGSDAACRNL